MSTEAHTPPMKQSEESDQEQLRLAREQGDVYVQALNHMANEEADDGGEKPAGEYVVAYAIEEAEGMYHWSNGNLEWQNPTNENVHIEIAVRDGADNRFIPGLKVHATLISDDGTEVGTHIQPFLWHPWLYHYGRNWEVPGDGKYTLRVRIDPPDFARHDHENGKRFAEPVEVEFEGVEIETGQKRV